MFQENKLQTYVPINQSKREMLMAEVQYLSLILNIFHRCPFYAVPTYIFGQNTIIALIITVHDEMKNS